MEKLKTTMIRIEPDVWEDFRIIALKQKRSASAIMRDLIKKFNEENKDGNS